MSQTDQTATQVYQSATGFEEIAVKKAFGTSLTMLAKEDRMTFARALVFVTVKRDGQNDMQAKQTALGMSNADLQDFFTEETEEETEETLAAAKAEARSMAEFCIRTGQSKETYLSLTAVERQAFIEVHNEDAPEV